MEPLHLNRIVSIVEGVDKHRREVDSEVELSAKAFIELLGPHVLTHTTLRSDPRLKNDNNVNLT